jgi:hypothetical protein
MLLAMLYNAGKTRLNTGSLTSQESVDSSLRQVIDSFDVDRARQLGSVYSSFGGSSSSSNGGAPSEFAAWLQSQITKEKEAELSLEKKIKEYINATFGKASGRRSTSLTSGGGSDIDMDVVARIVDEQIRLYDADKTGRPDYALESSGKQGILKFLFVFQLISWLRSLLFMTTVPSL